MKKEDKGLIIGQLTEIVKEYPNFYLTDIEALDAEKTSKLRRECFKKEIKLVVVKNNLLKKALENVEGDFSPLQVAMKGNTAVMFSQTANAPARLIKEFTKDAKKDAPVKPELKAAYVQESFYIGAKNLEDLGKYQEQKRTYRRCYHVVAISGEERYLCSSVIRTNYPWSVEDSGRKIIFLIYTDKQTFKSYKNGRFESFCRTISKPDRKRS